MKFHLAHGQNITLSEDRRVAARSHSFANALVFSERPLEPTEVFLIEILEQQEGWAGYIRCGITFHNPTQITIPQYLLPDLMKLGQSYIYAIKPCHMDPFNDANEEFIEEKIEKCPDVRYCDHLDSSVLKKDSKVGPCQVGSRIGILVSPGRELYFVVNGVQYGPCSRHIPENIDIYATADLYGNTKKIGILDFHVPRLKTMCTGLVSTLLTEEEIEAAWIPRGLKHLLLSRGNNKTNLYKDLVKADPALSVRLDKVRLKLAKQQGESLT